MALFAGAAIICIACQSASRSTAGIVTEVQATADGTLRSFTLQTPGGKLTTFRLGALESRGAVSGSTTSYST